MTMDDLLRYSAADLDPYTVAIAQQLCSKFPISTVGYRNLGTAFDSLPSQHYAVADFEIGYGAYHVLPALLKTDAGFALASVIGSLAEYFDEVIVVDFLRLLADRAGLPHSQRPLQHQWSQLVHTFNGCLSASSFGLLLSDLEVKLPAIEGELNLEILLDAWTTLSNAAQSKGQAFTLPAIPGYIWLATMAKWIYDLDFVMRAADQKVIYNSASTGSEKEPALVFSFSPQPASEVPGTAVRQRTTGGRVSFEHFFSSCFGNTATVLLKDKAFAAYVSSALTLVTTTLQRIDPTQQPIFLSREVTIPGSGTSLLVDPLLAWFPELGRQSRQFSRHAQLSEEQALALFQESVSALSEQCACSTCATTAGGTQQEQQKTFCNVTLADFIVMLAIYINPMTVAPKLLPKRNGILALYEQCHQHRLASGASGKAESQTPALAFVSSILTRLPASAEMVRVSALLFANTIPSELLKGDLDVMGITSTGLTIFLSGDTRHIKAKGQVSVVISPGWMCLFGHETRLEVFEPAFTGWDFGRHWREIVALGPQLRQIVKWKERRTIATSLVLRGSEEEKQAEREGWNLF